MDRGAAVQHAAEFDRNVRACGQLKLSTRPDQPFWIARPVATHRAEGWLSLCDIYPADGAIEIGSIWFSPRMQRTRASTEAVFLLMTYALDVLGYKRVWCGVAVLKIPPH
jgi:RimJ/RimL family protein N-acetyltransferase